MPFITIVTYAVLTGLWGTILAIYLRQRAETRRGDPLVALLLSVLALDAFKSVVESVYFGLVWGAQYRLLGSAFEVLSAPVPLTAVKAFNVLVATIVLWRLVRVWVPRRLAERQQQRERLDELARVQTETAERLRVAFNTIPDAVSIGRLSDGVNVAVSSRYCAMSGFAEAEVLGRTSNDLKLWIDPAQRASFFQSLLETGQVQGSDTRFRRKDGTSFDARCTSRVFEVSGVKYFLTVSRDVTREHRMEQAQAAVYRIAEAASCAATLEELLAKVHAIVGGLMPLPNFYIAVHDPASDTLSFPYFADDHDAAPPGPQPMGKGLTEYVLRTGKPLLLNGEERLRELIAGGEVEDKGAPSTSWLGIPLRAKDRTVGVLGAQIYSGEERYGPREVELLQFVSTQIANAIEKKQADLLLRVNEERFRALIEHTSGVCLLDALGRVRYASPSAVALLGRGPDETLSDLGSLVHPDDREALLAKLAESIRQPAAAVVAQVRLVRKDGSAVFVEAVLTNLLHEPAVDGVVLNLHDLSERKRLEAQLMMSDRMASLGVLAAGVAHEINNPLAYVVGNLSLLEDAQLSDPVHADALRAAQEGAERVRQIVRDLKTFSRPDDSRVAPTDVRRVLDSAVNMAKAEIRKRAELVRDEPADLPYALASEARLGQVVLNLLVNAAQAMPDQRRGNLISLVTRAAGRQVSIEVRDNGVGISPEHRARLFDPFFTTKPAGVGTGLGLYICQQLLGGMGGTICVESEPGKGSTFRIALPIAPDAERSVSAAVADSPAPSRILAIDDEPQIGKLLKHTLRVHDLVALTSAAEALQRLRAGERFDLILCDLMMPGMTGMDFHAALAAEFPDQLPRLLFLTGGAATSRARDFLEKSAMPWVQKPFEVAAMRKLVAERLAADTERS
jgi:PAS domain S-box-containing protein